MSDYDGNEDAVFYAALAAFVLLVLIGAVVLASGHGIYMPPDFPTVSAGETTIP